MASPDIVLLTVVPLMLPGLIVHVPDGKPFNSTAPVETVHVG